MAAPHPQPPVPSRVTKVLGSKGAPSSALPALWRAFGSSEGSTTPGSLTPVASAGVPAVVKALAPEQYKVPLTITGATHRKLKQVQDLLRHVTPTGDLAVIFDRALTLLLADLKRQKCAHVARPRAALSIDFPSI
jgi:hypothetical protein